MGRRDADDGPDYHKESRGERGDRLAGTSTKEVMKQARKDDVLQDKGVRRKTQVNVYIVINLISVVLLVVGLCTVYWYSYSLTDNTLSSAGNTISRTQEWGITINGVWNRLTYCRLDTGACTIERDRFRYFEQDQNEPEMMWGDAYIETVAQAAEGALIFYALLGMYFMFNVGATTVLMMTFFNTDSRRRMIIGTVCSFLQFLSLCTGLVIYVMYLSDLVLQLKEANFIVELTPELRMDYSLYCALGAVFLIPFCTAMLYLLIRDPAEDLDCLSEDARLELARRRGVVRRYFNDVDATTQIYESNPIDNFSGRRFPGWTQEVDMGSPNVLHSEDNSTELALQPIPSVLKDPSGLQQPVMHNQPMAKKNHLDQVPDVCKVPKPVPHGFGVMTCLENGVNSPGSCPVETSPKRSMLRSQGPSKLPPLPGSTGPDVISPLDKQRLGARPESRRQRRVTRAPKAPSSKEAAKYNGIIISHDIAPQ